MYSLLLQDLLQDIKDDGKFPLEASKKVQIAYLNTQALRNPNIKGAIKEFKVFLDSGEDLKEELKLYKETVV